MFAASDLRAKFYSTIPFGGSPAKNDAAGDFRRLGPSNLNLGMDFPDMYLMRAECEVRINKTQDAINDLQSFRNNRMNATEAKVPTNLAQKDLIQFILDERVREYACLGYRWFDMRRMSTDPIFQGATYTHLYHTSTGDQTFTLQQPDRFTLRFPQQVIDQNQGMMNNP